MLQQFGENLRRERKRVGLSQDALADKAGIDRTQVSVFERGTQEPKLGSLVNLAGALGCTIADLTRGIP